MAKIHYHQFDIPNNLEINGDLAIDTETLGLNLNRDRLCVLQFSNGDGEAHLVHFPEANYDCPNLKQLLKNSGTQKIFHFARFDVAIIWKYLDIKLENIFCTKIASRLCRTYTDQHGLKDLCSELANIKISKQQQSSNWGADSLSEEQKLYAAGDVLHLHKLRNELINMLNKVERLPLAKEAFKALPMRVELDLNGFEELDIFAH